MKNYQNPMFMNPNMYNQQGFPTAPQQQGMGYAPQEMVQGTNVPQMGYPGASPYEVEGSQQYPIHQQMMDEDCGCGAGHEDDEAVMSAGFNPQVAPNMAPQMMGPHGPGCGCGHPHGPMGGPGMMGGFGPQGPAVGPMGGFGPQGPGAGPMAGFGPQGPGAGPMAGFGPGGPGAGPMAGFGPHGPGCGCGQHHGPMGGPGMMGGFGPR